MKKIFTSLLVLFVAFSTSCVVDKSVNSYADAAEVRVIDKMNCWSSYSAELIMNMLIFEKDSKKISEAQERWSEELIRIRQVGQNTLKSDSAVIEVFRSDSVFQLLSTKRSAIAKQLSQYKMKVPFFKSHIEKIIDDIVEYQCHSHKVYIIIEKGSSFYLKSIPFRKDFQRT